MAGAVMAMHPMLPNYTARYWKLNQVKNAVTEQEKCGDDGQLNQ